MDQMTPTTPNDKKRGAPAPFRDDENDDGRRQRSAKARTGVRNSLREPAFGGAHPAGQRSGGNRERARFTETEENLDGEHGDGIPCETGERGEGAPPGDDGGQRPPRAEAVAKPSAGNLEQRIGDAEGKRDVAHHQERDPEILHDYGTGDGKNLPIHVSDHVGRHGQAENGVAHVCGSGRYGRGRVAFLLGWAASGSREDDIFFVRSI